MPAGAAASWLAREEHLFDQTAGEATGVGTESAEVAGLMHIQQGPYAYYVSVGWGCSVCLWPDPDRGDGASAASRVVRKLEGHTDDVLSVSRVGVELYDSSLHSFLSAGV